MRMRWSSRPRAGVEPLPHYSICPAVLEARRKWMDPEVREQCPVCDGGIALVSFPGYSFLCIRQIMRQKVVGEGKGEESGNKATGTLQQKAQRVWGGGGAVYLYSKSLEEML